MVIDVLSSGPTNGDAGVVMLVVWTPEVNFGDVLLSSDGLSGDELAHQLA
jgi:hypothetical protein